MILYAIRGQRIIVQTTMVAHILSSPFGKRENISQVPLNQVKHNANKKRDNYFMRNMLQTIKDTHPTISTKAQLINTIVKTSFWMKHNNVSFAVKCYDAIYYKLLWINVIYSNQLMKLIHSHRLNILQQKCFVH